MIDEVPRCLTYFAQSPDITITSKCDPNPRFFLYVQSTNENRVS